MTIVIGWTATPEGRSALAYAITEAAVRKTPLTVHGAGPEEVDELGADIEMARAAAGSPEVDVTVHEPEAGDTRGVADRLVDVSFEDGVELLVIGVKRRSPVGKLLLGSLAQRVLLEANCPVLAVKPPVTARR